MGKLSDILKGQRKYLVTQPVEISSVFDKNTLTKVYKLKTPRLLFHPEKKYRRVYTTMKTYDEIWYKSTYETPDGRKQSKLCRSMEELRSVMRNEKKGLN